MALLAFLLGFWLLACYSLFINPPLYGSGQLEAADAVVVLGGDSAERLPTGQELVAAGYAPVLALSHTDTPGNVDSDRLCKRPAHPTRVCFEPDPLTTRGEARTLARLAADNDWDRLLVVTSEYHAVRAYTNIAQCSEATLIMVPSEPDYGLLGWLPRFVEESAALAASHLRPVCANSV